MAGEYSYQPVLIIESFSGLRAQGAVGYFLDQLGGSPQPLYDLNLSPITSLVSNSDGVTGGWRTNVPYGFLIFGSIQLPVVSVEAYAAAVTAGSATASAAAAAEAAAASAASALAAQIAAETASGGGGTGGLSVTELEARLGGATGATNQLIPKLLMPYARVNGVWPARPNWGGHSAMAIGIAPGPADLLPNDIYVEVAV